MIPSLQKNRKQKSNKITISPVDKRVETKLPNKLPTHEARSNCPRIVLIGYIQLAPYSVSYSLAT
jgi:hypothetical protein